MSGRSAVLRRCPSSGSFVSAFTVMAYFNDVNLQKAQNAVAEPYEKSLEKLQKGELDALFITTSPGMPLQDAHVLATPGFLFANAKLSSTKVRAIAKKLYGKADTLKQKSGLWQLVSQERAKKDMKFGIGFHPGAKAYLNTGK